MLACSCVACAVAHVAGAVLLRRSILTEPMHRRGVHVNREARRQLLDTLRARDVMLPAQQLVKQPASSSLAATLDALSRPTSLPACQQSERVCAVIEHGACVALATPSTLQQLQPHRSAGNATSNGSGSDSLSTSANVNNLDLGDAVRGSSGPLELADAQETAANLANRMVRSGITRVCVIGEDGTLLGVATRESILTASLGAEQAIHVEFSQPIKLCVE